MQYDKIDNVVCHRKAWCILTHKTKIKLTLSKRLKGSRETFGYWPEFWDICVSLNLSWNQKTIVVKKTHDTSPDIKLLPATLLYPSPIFECFLKALFPTQRPFLQLDVISRPSSFCQCLPPRLYLFSAERNNLSENVTSLPSAVRQIRRVLQAANFETWDAILKCALRQIWLPGKKIMQNISLTHFHRQEKWMAYITGAGKGEI